jgi:hypothetical protein
VDQNDCWLTPCYCADNVYRKLLGAEVMQLFKMPGLVDIQKMKASTDNKKRLVQHLRFLAQRLANAQPLPLRPIAPSIATQRSS